MLTLLLAAAQAAATPVTVPPQPQLTEQIRAAHAALFKLFFEGPCNIAGFRAQRQFGTSFSISAGVRSHS